MAADDEEEAPAGFASLPHALALNIHSRLPVDARARAACVCRGWCTTLADVSLWTRLDLSPASGVTCSVNDAVLFVTAARARGGLEALNVSDCSQVSPEALLTVVTSNAGALRGLQATRAIVDLGFALRDAEALLRAAPMLRSCDLSLHCHNDEAPRVLRNEPPFGAVRNLSLTVVMPYFDTGDQGMPAIVEAVAASRSLRKFGLRHAVLGNTGAIAALFDALLAQRVLGLSSLYCCQLGDADPPALARLLAGNTLLELHMTRGSVPLGAPPSVTLLRDALRANSTLTAVSLHDIDSRYDGDAGFTMSLLNALTAHARLRSVRLHFRSSQQPEKVLACGAALGALVAADAPALTELDVSDIGLLDVCMGALMDALPHNTHLLTLNCSCNVLSAVFVRERLLPAVRANTSLRSLVAGGTPAEQEAMALVAARTAAGSGAHA
jgi:hypothetical protein